MLNEKNECCNRSHEKEYGLEEHLNALAERADEYKILATLWDVHKRALLKQLVPNPFLFGTYSDHGQTHSAAIVNAINRLLGPRVVELEATDTWMILECAYRHDAGMNVQAQEISEFVKTHEFLLLIRNAHKSENEELRDAAEHLFASASLLPDNQLEFISESEKAEWIITYQKYLYLVLSGYFRNNHAERSKNMIEKDCDQKLSDGDIPDRLWTIMALICLGHMKDRQYILDTFDEQEQGIGKDTMHPRFVQILLRIGDLLDLDNNRFNFYSLKQWGDSIPDESLAHIFKHKAIKHFYIDHERIEVTADLKMRDETPNVQPGELIPKEKEQYKIAAEEFSNNHKNESAEKIIGILQKQFIGGADERIELKRQEKIYRKQAQIRHEACRITANWFQMIANELEFFAKEWVAIAPPYLTGSVPKLTQKKVFWQNTEMDYDTINLKYTISHRRAAGIIQGTGLYGSVSNNVSKTPTMPNKELVFIRELVQNAMDATKIQIFRYLKEDRYGDAVICFGNRMSDWNPITVLRKIGDSAKNYKVELRIDFEFDDLRKIQDTSTELNRMLKIEVRDVGTGIDDKALVNMSKIGDTRDDKLRQEILTMPEWLRPNGSFGIGMQSVFGIVKEFHALSGSRVDHKVRDLFFQSADNSGALFATERTDKKVQSLRYGTRINVEIKNADFIRLYNNIVRRKNENCTEDENDYFDMCFECDQLFQILLNDTVSMLGQDILPIEIRYFVKDIEVKKYANDTAYADKVNITSVFQDFIHPPEDAVSLAEDTTLLLCNEKGLMLISYDHTNHVLLKMRLRDIPSDGKIDERSIRKSALRPIKLFYRGMCVLGVEKHREFPYPSWDIEAFVFWGKAEDYVAINRNYLVPDKKDKLYSKIANCADEALDLLFKHFTSDGYKKMQAYAKKYAKNYSEKLQTQINALSLSLLYHEAVSAYRKHTPFIDFNLLRKEFILREDMNQRPNFTIPIIENEQIMRDQPVNLLFESGLFTHWYINPNSMPYITHPKKLADNNFKKQNIIIIQDIFGSYLRGRKFNPCAENVSVFCASRDTVQNFEIDYIYKMSQNDAKPLDQYIYVSCTEILKNLINEIFKSEEFEKNCTQRMRLLPAFREFSSLHISAVPFDVPENIQFLGKYVIVPFTDQQLMDIYNKDESYIHNIAQKMVDENIKEEDKHEIQRKIIKTVLLDDDDNITNSHFDKVIRFVSKEMGKFLPKLTKKDVENRCKVTYIHAAIWFVNQLGVNFFDAVICAINKLKFK